MIFENLGVGMILNVKGEGFYLDWVVSVDVWSEWNIIKLLGRRLCFFFVFVFNLVCIVCREIKLGF